MEGETSVRESTPITTTPEPDPSETPMPDRRNPQRPFMWPLVLAGFLTLAVVALSIWAVRGRSELSDTQSRLSQASAELAHAKARLLELRGAKVDGMKPMPNTVEPSDEPINVMEWSHASKILADARGLIEKDGWQQGATKPVESWCVSTALEGAWLRTPYSIVDFNYARDALSRVIGVSSEPAKENGTDAPDVPYWAANFVEWNDAPSRTEDEVLHAFGEAAHLADGLSNEARAAAG